MSSSLVKVSNVCEQLRGVSYSGGEAIAVPQSGYLAVLRANNITDDGLSLDDLTYVPETRISAKQLVIAGDVVIAASSGSLTVVGKAAPAMQNLNMGFGAFCKVLRPNSKVDHAYFAHFFKTRSYRQKVSSLAAGANINNLRNEHLDDLPFPLPPLPEQRRIAAILDQAETLRTQRRTALALLDSLTQSLFLDMFGDPVANPKGWPIKPISALGKVVTGNTPSRDVPEYYGNSVEWIKSDNLNTPHYYVTKATEGLSEAGKAVGRVVPPNSILVTCIAGSPDCIGNAAMADREVAFNQQINAFIPVELDAHFAYAQIVVGKKLIQAASTNGMKGMVSKSRFEAIEFMVPPLPLQQTFATRIAAIEALKTTHRRALAALDALFASLQQRAFTGAL